MALYTTRAQATRAAFDACRINKFECENVRAPWSRQDDPHGVGHQFMRFVSFDRRARSVEAVDSECCIPSLFLATQGACHTQNS